MNPFARIQEGHLRVACQIARVESVERGTLVDLITLEPAQWHDQTFEAGTPFALGFAAAASEQQDEFVAAMRALETACAVLDLIIDEVPDGLRYQFAGGDHHVEVTVDARDLRL